MAYFPFVPLSSDCAALRPERISGILFGLGIAGSIANIVLIQLSERGVKVTPVGVVLLSGVSVLLLMAGVIAPLAASALVVIGGLASKALHLSLHTGILVMSRYLKGGNGSMFASLCQLTFGVNSLVGDAIPHVLTFHLAIALTLAATVATLGLGRMLRLTFAQEGSLRSPRRTGHA